MFMSKLGDELLKIALANPDVTVPGVRSQPLEAAELLEIASAAVSSEPFARIPLIESEHHEQVKLFRWAEQNLDKWNGVLAYMFAIPNGGHRHPATAGKMKAEGVKRGVPDIFLPHAIGKYHGLFVEMKVKSNKPSCQQREFIARLLDQGYKVVVCYSCQEAIEKIKEYLCIE